MTEKQKAYCGDGLLRYCLGAIYFKVDMPHAKACNYIQNLSENKTLAAVVLKNVEIFGKTNTGSSRAINHMLGTIYEAHLFDVCNNCGHHAAISFIINTFGIVDGEHPKDTYQRLMPRQVKEEVATDKPNKKAAISHSIALRVVAVASSN